MTVIIKDLEQGSPEWFAARGGIPTASCFGKIYTSTGKPSSSAKTYMFDLLADWMAGEPQNDFQSEAMLNGRRLEPVARDAYSFITDNEVDQVGIGYLDENKLVSASPDGLISEDGGLEIKCPKLATHLSYRVGKKCPAIYVPQVQGNMWVFGRKWWDFVSYHEKAKPFITRVNRDDKYIAGLSEAVLKFSDKLEELKLSLKEAE